MFDDDLRLHCLRRLHRGLAHDMRSPLNAAGLNLALLRRAAEGELGEAGEVRDRQLEWVDSLHHDLSRVKDRIELLLEALAPHTSSSDREEEVALRDVVSEIEQLVRPEAQRRRVELESAVDDVRTWGRRQALYDGILGLFVVALDDAADGSILRATAEGADDHVRLRLLGSGDAPSADNGRFLEAIRDRLERDRGSLSVETTDGGAFALEALLPAAGERQR